MNSKWILRLACMLQITSIGILFAFDAVQMKDRGIGEATIGLILGASSGVFIFSLLFWGRLADQRHWHKEIALSGSLAFSVLLLYFALCVSAWQFLVYAIAKALIAPMILGMMPALAVRTLGPIRQGRNFGVYRAFGSLGFVLGTMVLPLLFNDIATVARFGALIIVVSFFLLRRLPEPESRTHPAAPLKMRALTRTIKLFLFTFFFISLAEPAIQSFFSAYARQLGGSTRLLGLLSGMMGFMAMIFLPFMGRWIDRANPAFILALSFLAQPLRVFITSFIHQPEMLWIPILLHGVCWGGIEVAAIVYLSGMVKEGQKATVLSFYIAVRMLGNLVGASLSGYLAEHHGYVFMFRSMSALALLGALIYIFDTYVLSVRRARTPV